MRDVMKRHYLPSSIDNSSKAVSCLTGRGIVISRPIATQPRLKPRLRAAYLRHAHISITGNLSVYRSDLLPRSSATAEKQRVTYASFTLSRLANWSCNSLNPQLLYYC